MLFAPTPQKAQHSEWKTPPGCGSAGWKSTWRSKSHVWLSQNRNIQCGGHRVQSERKQKIQPTIQSLNLSGMFFFYNATAATTRGTNHHELFHAGQRCMLYDVKVMRENRAYVQSPRWGNEAHTNTLKDSGSEKYWVDKQPQIVRYDATAGMWVKVVYCIVYVSYMIF